MKYNNNTVLKLMITSILFFIVCWVFSLTRHSTDTTYDSTHKAWYGKKRIKILALAKKHGLSKVTIDLSHSTGTPFLISLNATFSHEINFFSFIKAIGTILPHCPVFFSIERHDNLLQGRYDLQCSLS